MGEAVRYQRDGQVAWLTMDRPESRNALSFDVRQGLWDGFRRFNADEAAAVMVLTGAGESAFCAGGDLKEMADVSLRVPGRDFLPYPGRNLEVEKPLIAAVNGAAAGAGMNLALAADIRISAEEAVFGQNFAKVGLFPDYGGTFFLPELAGPAAAAELFYTGEMIDSGNALRLGLVNRVVPGTQLESEVRSLATRIADGPQVAIRAIKRTLFGSQLERLTAALENEVVNQIKCFETADCLEGIRSFLEKRSPKFQGR